MQKLYFLGMKLTNSFSLKGKIVKESQTYCLDGAGVELKEIRVCDYSEVNIIKFLFMVHVMTVKRIDELFFAIRKLVAERVKCELDVLGGYEENYKDIIII